MLRRESENLFFSLLIFEFLLFFLFQRGRGEENDGRKEAVAGLYKRKLKRPCKSQISDKSSRSLELPLLLLLLLPLPLVLASRGPPR